MKTSIYSTAWNIKKMNFDYKGALDNWSIYADEILIAVNNCIDTYNILQEYIDIKNYPVKLIWTEVSIDDPFMYGKILDSALQSCTGDLLIQQDLDERLTGDKNLLPRYHKLLIDNSIKAFFIPTIDIYGDIDSFLNLNKKWYIHLPGLYRGPVNFGIKSDGRPDYNKTSSDELCMGNGELVPTYDLLNPLNIENLRTYAKTGQIFSIHLGYLNLNDRIERSKWWGAFWRKATGGDENGHASSIEELLKKHTKKHLLQF